MKKILLLSTFVLSLSGCALLSELTALTKCEFSFHSARDPEISGIDVVSKQSFSDFSMLEGQRLVRNILSGTLPFAITANVEIRNPGTTTATAKRQFSLQFVKTGKFDKKFGRLLNELYDWRQKADYEVIFDYDRDSVQPLFEPVKEMLDLIDREIKNTL
ncbi:MAG: hypothetical protein R6U78_06265 [Bacteroidales bacterium]